METPKERALCEIPDMSMAVLLPFRVFPQLERPLILVSAKRTGSDFNHPTLSSAEVEEIVQCISTPPLGLHGPFYGEIYFYLLSAVWKEGTIHSRVK
jgi:hypothetical protein